MAKWTACASANPLLKKIVKYLRWKGMDRVIFAAELKAYAIVGVSLSGGEFLNESRKVIY